MQITFAIDPARRGVDREQLLDGATEHASEQQGGRDVRLTDVGLELVQRLP